MLISGVRHIPHLLKPTSAFKLSWCYQSGGTYFASDLKFNILGNNRRVRLVFFPLFFSLVSTQYHFWKHQWHGWSLQAFFFFFKVSELCPELIKVIFIICQRVCNQHTNHFNHWYCQSFLLLFSQSIWFYILEFSKMNSAAIPGMFKIVQSTK